MDKGYIENGFIVDLSHAQKVSAIIYELSKILDLPEAQGKHICLKLGAVDLSENELTSVKNLVELMESKLACISTSSSVTLASASTLDISVSEFTNEIAAPVFETKDSNPEVEKALDNLFGDDEPVKETSKEDVSEVLIEDETFIEESLSDEEAKEQYLQAEKLPTYI